MPIVAIKTTGGQSAGEVTLSDKVFGAPRNIPLMHQAVKAELENRRQGTQDTLTRGDMMGGGRKPFKQKGTGRSRQGTVTAPHWRHGGTAFGPHPRDMGHAFPKKMKRAAILSALSAKLADGEMVIVEDFGLNGNISTKTAQQFLWDVAGKVKKSLVIVEASDEIVYKSLRNIDGVTLRVAPVFSTRDVVDGGMLVVTRAAAQKIEAQWGSGDTAAAAEGTTNEEVTEGENA